MGRVKCPWPSGDRIYLALADNSTLTYDLYQPLNEPDGEWTIKITTRYWTCTSFCFKTFERRIIVFAPRWNFAISFGLCGTENNRYCSIKCNDLLICVCRSTCRQYFVCLRLTAIADDFMCPFLVFFFALWTTQRISPSRFALELVILPKQFTFDHLCI